MKPNISRSGRVARVIGGLVCLAVGVTLWLVDWPESIIYRWIASILLTATGVFQFFEAKRGWCAIRACSSV